MLRDSPGISVKQGNGPRDLGISIRGSNARNPFGIRNLVIFEDGFPVTQPDGLSRSDLIDPRAYAAIDVIRGPSSALYGNYATGGALNFRTRRGGTIDGVEYGVDGGSFGYLNNYLAAGKKIGNFEASLFASDVRGDGYIGNSLHAASLLLHVDRARPMAVLATDGHLRERRAPYAPRRRLGPGVQPDVVCRALGRVSSA